jgi:hypothetical protein
VSRFFSNFWIPAFVGMTLARGSCPRRNERLLTGGLFRPI